MQYVFYVRCFGRLSPPYPGLVEHSEQTCNGSQKGNTFYEGRSQDHVGTNFVSSFRLAGNTFYSAFTDLSDTDTGTDGGETCADCAITRLCYIQQSCHQRHDTWFYNE
jgi:hypothetical protein